MSRDGDGSFMTGAIPGEGSWGVAPKMRQESISIFNLTPAGERATSENAFCRCAED